MFDDIQTCPRCEGYIDRDDFVQIDRGDGYMVSILMCQHCRWIRETLWKWAGKILRRQFNVDHLERKNPKAFAEIEQRLRDATLAPA